MVGAQVCGGAWGMGYGVWGMGNGVRAMGYGVGDTAVFVWAVTHLVVVICGWLGVWLAG